MSHSWSENKILTHLPAARQLYEAAYKGHHDIPFPPPRFLSVWLSEVCNLDCTYCFFSETNHDPERKFVEKDRLLRWLSEMREFGAEALEFSGGGEPTVHRDFAEIVLKASELGFALGLITHGCNEMPLELLAAKAKYVRVGLDAATPKTHMAIKRKDNPRFFEKAIRNIRDLVAIRDRNREDAMPEGFPYGFTVGIKVVLNSINYPETPEIVKLARDLRVDYIQIKYEHSSDHPLHPDEIISGQAYLDEEAKKNGSTRILGNLHHQRATVKCFTSPIHTVVTAMGEILQCCFFGDRPIGMIDQPIREVWGGSKHRDVMAMTEVHECDKMDCRFNFFNSKMKDVIEDPLQSMSFI